MRTSRLTATHAQKKSRVSLYSYSCIVESTDHCYMACSPVSSLEIWPLLLAQHLILPRQKKRSLKTSLTM